MTPAQKVIFNQPTTRLSRNLDKYERPKKTYQDTLTPEDMRERLINYEKVDNIDFVPVNTHVRYMIKDKKSGKSLFRLGGFLTKKNPSYVILSNGKFTWSVDRANATQFWRRLRPAEEKQRQLHKQEQTIEKQGEKIQELTQKLGKRRKSKPREVEKGKGK